MINILQITDAETVDPIEGLPSYFDKQPGIIPAVYQSLPRGWKVDKKIKGAYGIYLAHINAIKHSNGLTLILEKDAQIKPDRTSQLPNGDDFYEFTKGYDIIYLGWEDRSVIRKNKYPLYYGIKKNAVKEKQEAGNYFQPLCNPIRLHAYIPRNRDKILDYLTAEPKSSLLSGTNYYSTGCITHIDVFLGYLIAKGKLTACGLYPQLFGQGKGESENEPGKIYGDRFFDRICDNACYSF